MADLVRALDLAPIALGQIFPVEDAGSKPIHALDLWRDTGAVIQVSLLRLRLFVCNARGARGAAFCLVVYSARDHGSYGVS